MPGKTLNLDLHRVAHPQQPGKPLSLPSSANSSPTHETPNMEHLKKPFAFLKKRGSGDKDHNGPNFIFEESFPESGPLTLAMRMESPPAIFYGPPDDSTGALISGRVRVTPKNSNLTLDSMTLYLEATSTTRKPVANQCSNCATTVHDLSQWNFFTTPRTFTTTKHDQGVREFPFSHLVPGHLPATTHGQIASLDYSLHVRAKTDDGQEVQFRKELIIQRALRNGYTKRSDRIFTDTNLKMNAVIPNIVHPIGDFPVQWTLSGTITKYEKHSLRWYVRYVTWVIEEKETTISPACGKHAGKVGGEGRGINHENVQEIAKGESKEGWKTSHVDGHVEGEFIATINRNPRPNCDMKAENGQKIEHTLVLELVIGEVHTSDKKPDRCNSTGVSKRLKTRYGLTITERGGMGISWDQERPPNYEEVPPSPPHYRDMETRVTDYHASRDDLENDIERLNLNERPTT